MPRKEDGIWGVVIRSNDKKQWTCSYCGETHTGCSSRVKSHLIGGSSDIKQCSQKLGIIPASLVTQLVDEKEAAIQKSLTRKRQATALCSATTLKQQKISDISSKDRTLLAHRAVARCVYSGGLPFRLADTTAYREMCIAIQNAPKGYVPPTRQALGTTLLDEEYKTVKEKIDVFRENVISEVNPCTLTTDGWRDLSSNPLLNFILVRKQDIFFHDAVNVSGKLLVNSQSKKMKEYYV